MSNYITKIKLPKNTNLCIEISMDKAELDKQVRFLREAMSHYGREHPEANGEDIYNAFEDDIIEHFDQVHRYNFVASTPNDDRVEVVCLRDGLYEWNETSMTIPRRVHVRNGGPFEYGVIYNFPREDVRFEDEMGRWRI